MSRSSQLGLLGLLVLLSAVACKRLIYKPLAKVVAPELWENRPAGIACEPTASFGTLENNEVTFEASHMLCVDVQMNPDDFEVMRNESRFGPSIQENDGVEAATVVLQYLPQCDVPFPSEYNWYSADVTIDGHELANVGIRKKGFLGSIFSVAPAIKINTDEWVAGQQLGSTNRITLNNNSEDASRVIQCLNYHIYERAGYPAPRCNLANVSVNGEALGVYSHLESIDEQFLVRQFGNSAGHLYEGQLADFVERWRAKWEAKTDATNGNATPLLALSNVLDNASDEVLLEEVSGLVDMDRFMTFWAMEILLQHNDGYSTNRNNFFIYLDPANNGRITFIPWGLNYLRPQTDDSLEQNLKAYTDAELPRRLSRIPEAATQLENEVMRLLDVVWNEAELIGLADHFAAQAVTAEMNPDYEATLAEVREWIQTRRATLQALFVNGLPEGNKRAPRSCTGGNDE